MHQDARHGSVWMATHAARDYDRLHGDADFDVVVVGGGIAGTTAAALLQRAGRRVALVEMWRIGAGETGRTTAHLTELVDPGYMVIERKFGRENAKLVAESSRAAIDRIERFVRELSIDCAFLRVPAYLYAEQPTKVSRIKRHLTAQRRAGLRARGVREVPLPFPIAAAIRIEDQAQFHPLAYLNALAESIEGNGGCRIFERTRVIDVEDGAPCKVITEWGTIRARDVIMTTHVPVTNRVAIHTKLVANRTYAMALRCRDLPPAGLYWDVESPYHYTRVHDDLLIVGGFDHKTGHSDPRERMRELEQWARDRWDVIEVAHEWSGQIIEPADGLPFIGRNSGSEHLYVATGFSGTGMTFGTLSGMMLGDAVLGLHSPYERVYDATRVKPLAQAAQYMHNFDYPGHLVKDRFRTGDVDSFDEIDRGEGALVRMHGHMLAVARDEQGGLHVRSAVCTHMGCFVAWNGEEKSWDCPCHGSRFDIDGRVVNGPALKDLDEAELVAEKGEEPLPAS